MSAGVPEALVPGRGEAMKGNAQVNKALDYTKRWVQTLFAAAKEAAAANMDLKAAMEHTRKSMDPVFGHVFGSSSPGLSFSTATVEP